YKLNESKYFFLPKELLDKDFANFSVKAKLLFSIIITEADSAKAINEVADLIDELGSGRVTRLYDKVQREIKSQQMESEGA
ncbi:MAG: hypothetical protein UH241_03445, partial [Acutalibacteraceae bacterium]|nr:hypothetical protein [Acutalibacteraceae bacterium]